MARSGITDNFVVSPREAQGIRFTTHVYKDLSIWYAQNRDFGGSGTKNKSFFFKSILGTTTFFARPSGDFRYDNFFSLALRVTLGTITFFFRPSGDFRYNNRFARFSFKTKGFARGGAGPRVYTLFCMTQ